MNGKTIELINQMADKLGTTAEHLWGVLVKQAVVGAYAHMITWAFFGILCAATLALTQKRARRDFAEDEISASSVIFCVGVLATGIWLLVVSTNLSWIITRLANPEYWALDRILP